jgi:preprotein translocase subunit SecA
MGRFGIPEDEAIQNSMVSRALESAQTKIEGFNFDSRKQVLEYDNVLDKQRRAIYERRRKILVGKAEEVASVLEELAGESEEAKKMLAQKEEEMGTEQFLTAARGVLLQTLDLLWVEHLESMEYLRGSVNLRAYGQRDPLTEYRKEGTRIYKEMEETFRGNVFELLEKLQLNPNAPSGLAANPAPIINLTVPQGGDLGRNDKVTVTDGKETKEMKFKKAEPLLKQGWRIVEK